MCDPTLDSLNPAPLTNQVVGSRILIYDTVDSTNNLALRLSGDGTVVVADAQIAGRGRHGRAWHSAPGMGIWCSVGFDQPVEGLLFAAVLSVGEMLTMFLGTSASRLAVKWPNDLLVGERKIGGFLVECRGTRTVLGMGLNVSHRIEDFPEDIARRATSLFIETGTVFSRGPILRAILESLDQRIIALRSGGFDSVQQEWAAACRIEGRRIRYGNAEGRVTAVDANGALVMDGEQGRLRVAFGDIVELDGVE